MARQSASHDARDALAALLVDHYNGLARVRGRFQPIGNVDQPSVPAEREAAWHGQWRLPRRWVQAQGDLRHVRLQRGEAKSFKD